MNKTLDEDFLFLIYAITEEIPVGKVASYGQIAMLAGFRRNSRLVGKALSMASMYGNFPCHRVVNHRGRLVPGWEEQYQLLIDEGVTFTKEGLVNMKKCQWQIASD